MIPKHHDIEMEIRHEEDITGLRSEYFRCIICGFCETLECVSCGEPMPHNMIHDNGNCVYCQIEEEKEKARLALLEDELDRESGNEDQYEDLYRDIEIPVIVEPDEEKPEMVA